MIPPPPLWPAVFSAILTGLPALPAFADVPVSDGIPVSSDYPAQRVTVGFVTDEGAGAFQQVRDASGFATTEQGSIRCHIVANAGDDDPSITRGQAFALFAAWQAWVYGDQTLGGALPAGSVVDLAAQVDAAQNAQGSGAGLLVTVTYQATTYQS